MTRCFAALAIALVLSTPAAADRPIPLPAYTHSISGVPVTFTGQGSIAAGPSCGSVNLGVTLNLRDLERKLTGIVQRAVPAVSQECGERRAIHRVHLGRSGTALRIKADGMVGTQQCVRTKVPEFRGLKVTMKTRTVASKTIDSNASVAATFQPVVVREGKAIDLRLVAGPEVQVSNDLVRGLATALGFKGRIEHEMREAIQAMLRAERAMFRLPDPLAKLPFRLTDARIVDSEGLGVQISARATLPPAQAQTMLALLGLPTGNCP